MDLDKSEIIDKKNIDNELKESFLAYSMSVITNRAIPNLSDGLKPIQRRIIYAMFCAQMLPSKPTKKCAKIIGETISKFHPHGDNSVYDALVRMGQWFRIRYPLIKPQGNFGSIDGDNPAAMRYTEAKLTKYALTLLQDIEFDTVKYEPNYDNSDKEPCYLTSRLPNILLNGADGIAVGMATKIPSHNLSEIVDATIYLIKNRDATIDEILNFIKGPDFPTGGVVIKNGQIKKFYQTGKGSIIIESKWHIEENKKKRKKKIVITEVPYYVSKSGLILQISNFISETKNKEIIDVCDESSRKGLRITIVLKNSQVNEKKIIYILKKKTQVSSHFHANFVALFDQKPQENLNIKKILSLYIKLQEKLLLRKYKYLLGQTIYQTEILNSLLKAVKNIDEVINIIKNSTTKQKIISKLKLFLDVSTNHAQKILNLKLQRISSLEQYNLSLKIRNNIESINTYQKIIQNRKSIDDQLVSDLNKLKELHSDKRKSSIHTYVKEDKNEVIDVRECLLVLTANNYIKLVPLSEFSLQKRGGIGVTNKNLYKKDNIKLIIYCKNNDKLILFGNKGKAYSLMAYKISVENRNAKGTYIYNFLPSLEKNEEKIISIININNDTKQELLMFLTHKNKLKKMRIDKFLNLRRNGKKAINLTNNNDNLLKVIKISEFAEYVVASSDGRVMRSKVNKIRTIQNGNSVGVTVLKKTQRPISITTNENGSFVLSISKRGYGKLTKLEKHRQCGKNSSGTITMKINEKTGPLFFAGCVSYSEQVLINTAKNKNILISVNNVSIFSRNTSGVRIIKISKNDFVKSITVIPRFREIDYEGAKYPVCTT